MNFRDFIARRRNIILRRSTTRCPRNRYFTYLILYKLLVLISKFFESDTSGNRISGILFWKSYNRIFCRKSEKYIPLSVKFSNLKKVDKKSIYTLMVLINQIDVSFLKKKILFLLNLINCSVVMSGDQGDRYIISHALAIEMMFITYFAHKRSINILHEAHGRVDGPLYDGYNCEIMLKTPSCKHKLADIEHHYKYIAIDQHAYLFRLDETSRTVVWFHGFQKGSKYNLSKLKVDIKKLFWLKKLHPDNEIVIKVHPSAVLLKFLIFMRLVTKVKLYSGTIGVKQAYTSSPTIFLQYSDKGLINWI